MRPLPLLLGLLLAGNAGAHFALIAPASALATEDGGKGGPPCGLGIESNVVTEVQGGHPLPLRLQEFIFHPGHYRVALAVKSRDELPPDPDVLADADGTSISASIQNSPRIPVLADGLLAHTNPPPNEWSTQVVLPNINCKRCTLQIIEFMAEHGPSYFYHHCADLKITADPSLPAADAAWPRDDASQPMITNTVLPHIATGGGAQTAITLVNLDAAPAPFTLNFFGDDGTAGNTVTGTLPVGGSQTVVTDTSPPARSTGWAQLTSTQSIDGVALYRASASSAETALRPVITGSPRLLFPFDNSDGSQLEVALAAPGTTSVGRNLLSLRNQQGQSISDEPAIGVAANGHTSFVLPVRSAEPANARGVARIDQSNGLIYGVGFRTRDGSVTAIDGIPRDLASAKTLPHLADGGGWKTVITLVNCDAGPALYSMNFWGDDGKELPLTFAGNTQSGFTGTLADGGSATFETSGAAVETVSGWAEVLSRQCVAGTVLFRQVGNGQEAAMPLLSAGSRKLMIPFDATLGIALANISPVDDTTVTVTLRNEQGDAIATQAPVSLPHRQHASFALAIPDGVQRGVVELNSTNTDIFAAGIRTNNGAITYIRALSK